MRHGQALSVILTLAVATAGCVAKETYESAVQESEQVRVDLDREQAQMRALEQQIKSMDEHTNQLRDEAKLAVAEVQRLRDSGDKELSGVDGRVKELDHKLKELAAQNKMLQSQTHDLKKRNASLEAMVAKSQANLKEQQRVASAMGGSGSSSRPNGPAAGPQGGPQVKPAGTAPGPQSAPGGAASAPSGQVAGTKAQDAQGGPSSTEGKAGQPVPTQEDLGLIATIKHWLSTIWHWIF